MTIDEAKNTLERASPFLSDECNTAIKTIIFVDKKAKKIMWECGVFCGNCKKEMKTILAVQMVYCPYCGAEFEEEF